MGIQEEKCDATDELKLRPRSERVAEVEKNVMRSSSMNTGRIRVYALLERVTLPMENVFAGKAPTPGDELSSIDHVGQIKLVTSLLLTQIAQNPQTRRVLEVATQKVEYVEKNQAIRARHLTIKRSFMERCDSQLELAERQAGVTFAGGPQMAACGFHAMINGLIQNWLLDPSDFDLIESGACAMDIYLAGLGRTHADAKKSQTPQTQVGADLPDQWR